MPTPDFTATNDFSSVIVRGRHEQKSRNVLTQTRRHYTFMDEADILTYTLDLVKGSRVRIPRGPAAVIEDESRKTATVPKIGMGRLGK